MRRRPFPNEVLHRDTGSWRGARVEVWREAGSELAETVLPTHGLAMTLGPTDALEVSFAGERAHRGTVQSGAVCVVPAGVPYRVRRLRAPGVPSMMVVVALEPSFVSSVSRTAPIALRPSFARADALTSSLIEALGRDVQQGRPCGDEYGKSLLAALAAHVGRASAPEPVGPSAAQIEGFVHARLHTSLSLAELAEVAACDVRSLTRWFRAELGTSPHRYVSAARVERAKQHLRASEEGLARIASLCGFSSQSHFTTVFRQHTGLTPAAFRRAWSPRQRAS